MDAIREYIGTKYSIVGVKFFKERVAESEVFKRPKKAIMFCQAIKESAEKGESFLFYLEDEACPSAIVALGYEEPTYIEVEPRIKPAEIKAIKIAPHEKLKDADVFLAVLNPKQAMEIGYLLQGVNASFSGSIAVCGEAAALSYMEKKPNLTFLCSGARLSADFKESEVVLSLTHEAVEKLNERIKAMSRVCAPMCGCRTSDIPQRILLNFKKLGFEKGIDYFFGKTDGHAVRIYLNKDFNGKIAYITLHFPLKGKAPLLEHPFTVKERGNWSDVSITFDLKELGEVDINTGKGLKDFIAKIAAKIKAN